MTKQKQVETKNLTNEEAINLAYSLLGLDAETLKSKLEEAFELAQKLANAKGAVQTMQDDLAKRKAELANYGIILGLTL